MPDLLTPVAGHAVWRRAEADSARVMVDLPYQKFLGEFFCLPSDIATNLRLLGIDARVWRALTDERSHGICNANTHINIRPGHLSDRGLAAVIQGDAIFRLNGIGGEAEGGDSRQDKDGDLFGVLHFIYVIDGKRCSSA
jgi:hypothetical protein